MSFSLPESIALDLLHKLGHDDAFRDRFGADARAALAELGFVPAGDSQASTGIWDCLVVQVLASKETIRNSHGLLFRHFTTEKAGANPITLEVQRPRVAA